MKVCIKCQIVKPDSEFYKKNISSHLLKSRCKSCTRQDDILREIKLGKIAGIYKITNPLGRIYIGQSVNCIYRQRQYKNGSKQQRILHNSILKYGWGNHKFEIICECKEEDLDILERHYAEVFNAYSSEFGMNIRQCGGSKGKLSEETKKRISESNKKTHGTPEMRALHSKLSSGRVVSERTRLKISDSLRGRTGRKVSIETRKKQSEAQKGKKLSEATKQKLRICNKNKTISEETREKIRQSSKGRKHTLASKLKMSLGKKGLKLGPMSEECKSKISVALKGKKHSPEHNKKVSDAIKGSNHWMFGKKNTEEMKRKNSEANRGGKNANAKLVLNLETGIYYSHSKEAWETYNIKSFEYFKYKLQGKYQNNTSFLYV